MKKYDYVIEIRGVRFICDFAMTPDNLDYLDEFSKVCEEDMYTAYLDSGGFLVVY